VSETCDVPVVFLRKFDTSLDIHRYPMISIDIHFFLPVFKAAGQDGS
jgi:hypothetical protein